MQVNRESYLRQLLLWCESQFAAREEGDSTLGKTCRVALAYFLYIPAKILSRMRDLFTDYQARRIGADEAFRSYTGAGMHLEAARVFNWLDMRLDRTLHQEQNRVDAGRAMMETMDAIFDQKERQITRLSCSRSKKISLLNELDEQRVNIAVKVLVQIEDPEQQVMILQPLVPDIGRDGSYVLERPNAIYFERVGKERESLPVLIVKRLLEDGELEKARAFVAFTRVGQEDVQFLLCEYLANEGEPFDEEFAAFEEKSCAHYFPDLFVDRAIQLGKVDNLAEKIRTGIGGIDLRREVNLLKLAAVYKDDQRESSRYAFTALCGEARQGVVDFMNQFSSMVKANLYKGLVNIAEIAEQWHHLGLEQESIELFKQLKQVLFEQNSYYLRSEIQGHKDLKTSAVVQCFVRAGHIDEDVFRMATFDTSKVSFVYIIEAIAQVLDEDPSKEGEYRSLIDQILAQEFPQKAYCQELIG